MSLKSMGSQFGGFVDSLATKASVYALNNGLSPAGASSPLNSSGGPVGGPLDVAMAKKFGPFLGSAATGAVTGGLSGIGYHPGHQGAAFGVAVGNSGTGLSGGSYDASYDMGATKSPGRAPSGVSSPIKQQIGGQSSHDDLGNANDSLGKFLNRPSIAHTPQMISPAQFPQLP